MQLKPQPGPQTQFLQSSADVTIFGGAAGGGKSWGLLLEPLYDVQNPRFRAVLFRRTTPQLRQAGGLVDKSREIYRHLGAHLHENALQWKFPKGATVTMSHMEHASDRYNWQGSELSLIGFDELQEFDEEQFWFLLSRCRSMSGVRGRIRATCNPLPDSWLKELLGWWIGDDGIPIKERAGATRHFVRDGEQLEFADTAEALKEKFGPEVVPRSLCFIPASLADNKILNAADPQYRANLAALPSYERRRLLYGDWNARPQGGGMFKREWFPVVDDRPADVQLRVRFWDLAASENKHADWTVGALVAKDRAGFFVVEHVTRFRGTPFKVEEEIKKFARSDPQGTAIRFEEQPAAAGKGEAQRLIRELAGHDVRARPPRGNKIERATPLSVQAESGNVRLVRGEWIGAFLRELESFPEGRHDDQVDAASAAFTELTQHRPIFVA